MKKRLDLSIIIGTYNTKNLLKKTLFSIYRNTKNIMFEIILIDDASADGTYEVIKKQFPLIKIIKNEKNLGYSKTYNKGTKLAKGKYILHLNSDVYFTKNSNLALMIDFMDKNPRVGIAGCKVLKHNGVLDLPCRHAIPTLINVLFQMLSLYRLFYNIRKLNYYMTYLDESVITEVGGILGAFMLIRKKVFKKIGYLDENFYLYCEDTDFCYRAKRAGWEIYYYPKIAVKHLHGETTKQFRKHALIQFHVGMYYYYKKHHAKKNASIVNLIVLLAIILRFFLFFGFEISLYVKGKKIRLSRLFSFLKGKSLFLKLANKREYLFK